MLRLGPGKGQGARHLAAEIMEPVRLFLAGQFLPVGELHRLVIEDGVQVRQQSGIQVLFGIDGRLLAPGRHRQQIMRG